MAELHQANAEREARWPQGMLATSTHDTKRGEDVRARLAVLSECPARWWPLAARWTARLAAGVDPADALLLWQTMAGAWPLEQDRCLAYMEKAVREAGLHTTWTDPDPAYERALAGLVERAYADAALLAELEALVAEIAPAGRVKAAGLALLRLTSPGIPDTYQGTETEQLVLVDPDNRRPVPFTADDLPQVPGHPHHPPPPPPAPRPVHRLPPPRRPRTTWSPTPAATTTSPWSSPASPAGPRSPAPSPSRPAPGTTCSPAPTTPAAPPRPTSSSPAAPRPAGSPLGDP